jgi:hypothetical protein
MTANCTLTHRHARSGDFVYSGTTLLGRVRKSHRYFRRFEIHGTDGALLGDGYCSKQKAAEALLSHLTPQKKKATS